MPKKKARGVEAKKSSRYTMVSSGMGPTLAVQPTPEKQVGHAVPYEAVQSGFGDLKKTLAMGDISLPSHTTGIPDTPAKKPKVLMGTSVADIINQATIAAQEKINEITAPLTPTTSGGDGVYSDYEWSLSGSYVQKYDLKQPPVLIAEGHGASLSDTPPEPHREDYLDSMIEGKHRLDALDF